MRQISLPCHCAGTCSVVLVTEFEPLDAGTDHEPQEFFVEFYEAVGRPRHLRDRLRVAWGALRGKGPFTHSVAWTDSETPIKLRDFLNEVIPVTPASEGTES